MDADKKKAKRLKREERRRQALLLEKQAGASPGPAHCAAAAVVGRAQEHATGGAMHGAAGKM